MSIKSIDSSAFYLEPLQESAYQLKIHFMDEHSNVLSKKNFCFIQSGHPADGEMFDIYSQNGVCQENILEHLFEKRDEKDISKIVKQHIPSGPRVLVLDLQDPHTHYSSCTECHRR